MKDSGSGGRRPEESEVAPRGAIPGVNSRIEHKTSGWVCVNNTVAMSSSSLSGAGDMPRAILTVDKVSLVDTLIVLCAILPRKKELIVIVFL